jgi:hypothetical protein
LTRPPVYLALVGLFIALTAVACSKDTTATTSPSTAATTTTELFTGTLAVGDLQFYSFTVTQSGSAVVTLASLQSAPRTTLSSAVGIGVGVPAGTGCATTTTMNVVPGLTAQLSAPLSPGIYCVDVYDIGTLTGPATFAVRLVHP